MKKKKGILIVLIVLIIVFIAGAAFVANIQKNLDALADVSFENIDLSNIKDGTYYGKYGSIPVSAEVKVTVTSHAITDIELVKHNNGKGEAAEIIPEKVTEAQSLQVDTISGATYSSIVILKAIENALLSGN